MRLIDFFQPRLTDPLLEVKMTPGEFEKFASGPAAEGIEVGFEFELCVIGAGMPGEMENDFDNYDAPVYTSDGIYKFFTNPDSINPTRGPEVRVVVNQLQSDYEQWVATKWRSYKNRIDLAEPRYKERMLKYMDDHEYSTAREMFWDELEQDFYASDNNSFQAYMEDMDTPMMSNIYLNWSDYLEWPWTSEDPLAGLDWIANQFTEDTGWPTRVSPGYHTASRESSFGQGKWIVEPDGSIEPKSADDAGLEFISPPMPLGEALAAVKKMRDWAEEYAYTNTSTGLHINVSVPDLLRRNIDYVKLALFLGDKYLLELFKRTNNEYTRGSLEGIEKKVGWMTDDALERLRNTIRTGALKDAADNIQAAYTDKYNSINVKDGYIEFRSPGGDYLNSNLEDITRAVIRMAMALKIATDPQAYREEYQKKFYKLLAPKPVRKEFPHTSDLMQLYIYGDARQRAFAKGRLREKLTQLKQGQQGKKEWWIIDDLSSRYPLLKIFAANEEEAKERLAYFRKFSGRVDPLWVKPAGWTPDSPRSPEQSWTRQS